MPIRRPLTAFVALCSAAAIATVSVPQAVAAPDDTSSDNATRTHSPPSSDNQYVARGRGGGFHHRFAQGRVRVDGLVNLLHRRLQVHRKSVFRVQLR
ncbi:MAG: hypothetical protein L0K86_28145, partial [Actinomycetia bacterium]|nr:hypothetical protein [Actinomycetes bacterium]